MTDNIQEKNELLEKYGVNYRITPDTDDQHFYAVVMLEGWLKWHEVPDHAKKPVAQRKFEELYEAEQIRDLIKEKLPAGYALSPLPVVSRYGVSIAVSDKQEKNTCDFITKINRVLRSVKTIKDMDGNDLSVIVYPVLNAEKNMHGTLIYTTQWDAFKEAEK